MNTFLNSLARSLIWVLWALPLRSCPSRKKSSNPPSPAGDIIHENNGNTIEYFHHKEDGSPTNILILTGVGRVNTVENIHRWKDYLGHSYNICIPNFPGYGKTSSKSRMFETTEDQILHNQKVLLDHLGWERSKTVLLGISYGSFVAVSTLNLFTPKLVILISPGKKIRQTHFTAEFGLLEYLRYFMLWCLAKVRVPEALSFDSEETLKQLNRKDDKPLIFCLHGSKDECIPPQDSEDLSKIFCPSYVTVVIGAKHFNTRFGRAQEIIQAMLQENGYNPPKSVTAEDRSSHKSAD